MVWPLDTGTRQATRRQPSQPIIEALHRVLTARLAQASARSKLAEAIRYATSRLTGLTLFLDDGRVELDNNIVERAIRPIALVKVVGLDRMREPRDVAQGNKIENLSPLSTKAADSLVVSERPRSVVTIWAWHLWTPDGPSLLHPF